MRSSPAAAAAAAQCPTYIEVLDVSVVLPEPPQPVGKVLHQLAAAADADGEAPQDAAGAEEQQGGEEEARHEHGVVSEVVRGSAGFLWRVAQMHVSFGCRCC